MSTKEGQKQRTPEFDPNNSKHLVKLQGTPYITVVGLQARLADQGKAIVETDTELLMNPYEKDAEAAVVRFSGWVLDRNGNKHGPFKAFGDASQKNVGPKLKEALIRMAETRAYGRALRIITRSQYTALEELPAEQNTDERVA